MKTDLTRDFVESLVDSKNTEFLDNINDLMENLIVAALNDVSSKNAFVRLDRCVFLPVNELYLKTVTQLSTYDYFLGIDNPQIESNSHTYKNFWKYVWREFKASWRIGRKKYKKQKKNKKAEAEIPSLQSVEKYKLSDFRSDLVRALANYLQPTSVIHETLKGISLDGAEDFGSNVRINIYIGVFDSKMQNFKLYNEVKNKYRLVDFGRRFSNLDEKAKDCENFVEIVEIFNDIFSHIHNRVPNQILIESMIYSCPNILFSNDLYKTFVNVANYIRLKDPKSIASICNADKNIFEEPLIFATNSQVDFSRIISMLDRFRY